MTSTAAVTTAVEQALLRLAEDGTTSVVASSLDAEQAELGWLGLVGPHLGFAEAPDPPGPAFSYHVFPNGFAAVLRRTWSGDRPGCVDAHALLGLDAQLTPAVALSISDWTGWRDESPTDGRLPRLRVDDVQVPDASARLRARALGQGDLLARSLAWLLQSPRTPIGLVGCPDPDRTALVWALWEIAAALLPSRSWTFSTHGDAPGDARPTAVTFFATPPARSALPDRLVIDLHRGQGASPQNEYRANALVYRYEYGIDPPSAAAAPAVLPVPAPAPGVPAVPVAEPVPARSTMPPWQAAELVRDVVRARDARALDGALVELEYVVAKVDDRDALRKAFDDEGWATAVIRQHVPFDLRDSVFDRVVQIAFGATGPGRATPGARADARRIAETSGSDDLVRAIARAGVGANLADVLARRWMSEHQPVAPDPRAGRGSVARLLRLPLSPAWERRIFLVLALLLSFVLGFVLSGVLR